MTRVSWPPGPETKRAAVAFALGFLFGLFAVAVAVQLTGCGGSQVQQHARAAYTTQLALTAAHTRIREARTAALMDIARNAPGDEPTVRAAVRAESARWEPVVDAYEVTRAALAAWEATILDAVSRDADLDTDAAIHAATEVVQSWLFVRELAADFHVHLPGPERVGAVPEGADDDSEHDDP